MKIDESVKAKYAEFINGLELKSIYLISAEAKYNYKEALEPTWKIMASNDARKENLGEQKYRVVQNWKILVKKEKEGETLLSFSFSFAVLMDSEVEMTEDLFGLYVDNNLNINTWPYARELINNITARMNIPPLTLPYFKAFVKEE